MILAKDMTANVRDRVMKNEKFQGDQFDLTVIRQLKEHEFLLADASGNSVWGWGL
jgi:hypothetical protein